VATAEILRSDMERAIVELHKIFRYLNKTYFNNVLIEPVILIQHQGNRRANVLGWCTVGKIWRDKENKISNYEITITAEYANRPYEEIAETMLHEMVHLYCAMREIKDTSRGNTYHNKRFKEQAERVDLKVEHNDKYGWAFTSPTEKLLNTLLRMPDRNLEAFTMARTFGGRGYRSGEDQSENEGKRKTSWKYQCPNCEMSIRASKVVNVKCGDCDKTMEEVI